MLTKLSHIRASYINYIDYLSEGSMNRKKFVGHSNFFLTLKRKNKILPHTQEHNL